MPVLQTPTAGATGVSLRPTFTWSSGAASYDLQLSTAFDFATLAYEATGLTEQSHTYPDTLTAETSYWWRVKACTSDQSTCSAWSPARSFTTGTGGSEVTAPVLAAPEDGSYIGLTTAVTLAWEPVGGATRYEVQVAEDGDFSGAPTHEATATTYTATGLTVQAAYGWRVKACDDLTCGAWSVAWTFRTEALEITRYYYLTGHLGSVRVTVNEQGVVVHRDDYYPFGLQMPQRSMETPEAPRERYTGHELEAETGLLYAGARYYDAVIGRWMSPDPLGGDYPGHSPYNYVLNNPLTLADPTGMCPEDAEEDGLVNCITGDDYLVVEADRTNDGVGFYLGDTFYYRSPRNRSERRELRGHMRNDPRLANIAMTSSNVSSDVQSLAMQARIHAAHSQFMLMALRISLETGADVGMVISLLSGAGAVAGAGALLLRRGGLGRATRNGIIQFVSYSSSVSLYASAGQTAFTTSLVPMGGATWSEVGYSALGTFASGIAALPAVRGVSATGLRGPAFRTVFKNEYGLRPFVTNRYGYGRFAISHTMGAAPGFVLYSTGH